MEGSFLTKGKKMKKMQELLENFMHSQDFLRAIDGYVQEAEEDSYEKDIELILGSYILKFAFLSNVYRMKGLSTKKESETSLQVFIRETSKMRAIHGDIVVVADPKFINDTIRKDILLFSKNFVSDVKSFDEIMIMGVKVLVSDVVPKGLGFVIYTKREFDCMLKPYFL